MTQYELPGVFTHNPHGASVNNPLWTLPYEAGLYVFIAMTGLFFGRSLRLAVLAIYLALLMLNLIDAANWSGGSHYRLSMNVLEFAAYFLAGSVVWTFRTGFVFRWYLALAALLVLIFRAEIGCDAVIWFMALPYIVLWLGLRDLPHWRWVQHFRRNDYSYGLYIWGSPAQQSIVALIGPASLLANFMLPAMLVGLAACLSWHCVEKRCLALKSRGIAWLGPIPSPSPAGSQAT